MDNNKKNPIIRFEEFKELYEKNGGDSNLENPYAWEQRKLKDESKISAGGDIDKSKVKQNGKYPVIANALTDEGIVGYYDEDYRIKAPAVTVTGRGDVGHARARKVNFTPVVRLLSVKSIHDVDFLENAINNVNFFIESTGVPQLTAPQLENLKIYFPCLEEQKKIGLFFKQLDDIITLQQHKVDKILNLKKAMLEKMFPKDGEKIPEVRFEKFKKLYEENGGDSNPENPYAWEQRKLGDLSQIIDPHPSHRAPAEVTEGIPFIGIGDVDEEGNIYYRSVRLVSEKIYDEHHKRYNLSKNSIGIGRVASLGKIIRLRNDIGKYAVSPTMAVIQFNDNIDSDFMYATMSNPNFQKQFKSLSNGSTRQSVGIQDLRSLEISISTNVDEQLQIGILFKNLDHSITLQQHKLTKLKNIKKALLKKMFI